MGKTTQSLHPESAEQSAQDGPGAGEDARSDKEGEQALDALDFADDLAVSRHSYRIPGLVPVHTLLQIRAARL